MTSLRPIVCVCALLGCTAGGITSSPDLGDDAGSSSTDTPGDAPGAGPRDAPIATTADASPGSHVDASPGGTFDAAPATMADAPATAGPDAAPVSPTYFSTLPPGATLPSDATCAAAIKHRAENKGVNASYNATRGDQSLDSNFLSGDDPRANTDLVPRVTGDFVGTTDEILQWAACKWGVDEDMVRAQAAVESWWRQTAEGDLGTDATRCPPGHGLGVDGHPGQCPESWGVLQNRYPYEMSSWPGIGSSTAFNADTAYAIWRACFEGYETWLNTVDRGETYAAGDAWGCMGRWFAGRWHTDAANGYVSKVQDYLGQRIWETASFQEP